MELQTLKQLAYQNQETEDTSIGFEFKGAWITNPFLEETGRFEFLDLESMSKHYGKENIETYISALSEANQTNPPLPTL